MLNNKYVINGIVALITTIILYVLSRNDENSPSWKVYLRHFIIAFAALSAVDFVIPTLTGGSNNSVSAPSVDIGQPDF
jgi:hypothetical protein